MDYYLPRSIDNDPIEPDFLPISVLGDYCFCPRLFWNIYVLRVNSPARSIEGKAKYKIRNEWQKLFNVEEKLHNNVRVYSYRLRIGGYTDLIEDQNGKFQVIECLEDGKGINFGDYVLVCAKFLCLVEMAGKDQVIPIGELFSGVNYRCRVEFTVELQKETEATIRRIFSLLANGSPPCEYNDRCRQCDLENNCFSQK